MSLHDRHYSRDHSGGGWSGGGGGGGGGAGGVLGQIGAFLNLSFPIGRVLGIRIRVHILFLLLIAFEIWPSTKSSVPAPQQMLHNLRWIGLLFGSVLLHEFGHCFGCRAVGGRADDILMWPLGGLATCDPPRRPWPEFVTVACGPLVNVALAGGSYLALLGVAGAGRLPVTFDPFLMWTVDYWHPASTMGARLLADVFVVNYALLLFNLLLIFYPFDGGRMVQIGLWVWLGYGRSMVLATNFGMVGAVLVAVVGLIKGEFLLIMIAIMGFLACRQQRMALQHGGAVVEDDPRFAAAYEAADGRRGAWFGSDVRGERDTASRGPGMFARWRAERAIKQAQARARQAKSDQEQVDRILDKVRAQGIGSLTPREKGALQRATDQQRGV